MRPALLSKVLMKLSEVAAVVREQHQGSGRGKLELRRIGGAQPAFIAGRGDREALPTEMRDDPMVDALVQVNREAIR